MSKDKKSTLSPGYWASVVKVTVLLLLVGLFLSYAIPEFLSYLNSPVIVNLQFDKVASVPLPLLVVYFPFSFSTTNSSVELVAFPVNGPAGNPGNLPNVVLQYYQPIRVSTKSYNASSPLGKRNDTLLVLLPRQNTPPIRRYSILVKTLNISSALETDEPSARPIDSVDVKAYVFLFGSRFTSNIYGSNLVDRLRTYPINTELGLSLSEILGPATAGTRRDVNNIIREGVYQGGEIGYSLKPKIYRYLNKSEETFFELTSQGRVRSLSGRNVSQTIIIESTENTSIENYIETKAKSLTTVIGTILSAFQFIMLTVVILVFGRGRYSPYGWIHRIFPGEALKEYIPSTSTEDKDFEKFRYLMRSYLDTSVLERNEVIESRTQSIKATNSTSRRRLPRKENTDPTDKDFAYPQDEPESSDPVNAEAMQLRDNQPAENRKQSLVRAWKTTGLPWLSTSLFVLAGVILALLCLGSSSTLLAGWIPMLVVKDAAAASRSTGPIVENVHPGRGGVGEFGTEIVDKVYLGIYGPAFAVGNTIVLNGAADLADMLEVTNTLPSSDTRFSTPVPAARANSSAFSDQAFTVFQKTYSTRTFISLSVALLFLLLSALVKVAAIILEMEGAISIADFLVPILCMSGAVSGMVASVFAVIYYGGVATLMSLPPLPFTGVVAPDVTPANVPPPQVVVHFGAGMVLLFVGAFVLMCLGVTEVLEGVRIRLKKVAVKERRETTTWLPPSMATWPRPTSTPMVSDTEHGELGTNTTRGTAVDTLHDKHHSMISTGTSEVHLMNNVAPSSDASSPFAHSTAVNTSQRMTTWPAPYALGAPQRTSSHGFLTEAQEQYLEQILMESQPQPHAAHTQPGPEQPYQLPLGTELQYAPLPGQYYPAQDPQNGHHGQFYQVDHGNAAAYFQNTAGTPASIPAELTVSQAHQTYPPQTSHVADVDHVYFQNTTASPTVTPPELPAQEQHAKGYAPVSTNAPQT